VEKSNALHQRRKGRVKDRRGLQKKKVRGRRLSVKGIVDGLAGWGGGGGGGGGAARLGAKGRGAKKKKGSRGATKGSVTHKGGGKEK